MGSGTVLNVAYSVQQLVEALLDSEPDRYVRLVAHWLSNGVVEEAEPAPTGDAQLDALVAAAVAHLAVERDEPVPGWTTTRVLDAFWHPGDDRWFAYCLPRTPQAFLNRGILVDRDSLVTV